MILKKIIKWFKRRKLVEETFRFWKIEYNYVSDLTKRFESEVNKKEEIYNQFIDGMKIILEGTKKGNSVHSLNSLKYFHLKDQQVYL